MKNLFYMLLPALALMACSKTDFPALPDGYEVYRVEAGKHSSDAPKTLFLGRDSLAFAFYVNPTWYYDSVPSNGMSKIIGLSWGHHQRGSSARLGYACYDGRLLLGAYCYADGTSPQEDASLKTYLQPVQPGEHYICSIARSHDQYRFYLDRELAWACRAGKAKGWGYLLGPYIGGSYTLDHDALFQVKFLN